MFGVEPGSHPARPPPVPSATASTSRPPSPSHPPSRDTRLHVVTRLHCHRCTRTPLAQPAPAPPRTPGSPRALPPGHASALLPPAPRSNRHPCTPPGHAPALPPSHAHAHPPAPSLTPRPSSVRDARPAHLPHAPAPAHLPALAPSPCTPHASLGTHPCTRGPAPSSHRHPCTHLAVRQPSSPHPQGNRHPCTPPGRAPALTSCASSLCHLLTCSTTPCCMCTRCPTVHPRPVTSLLSPAPQPTRSRRATHLCNSPCPSTRCHRHVHLPPHCHPALSPPPRAVCTRCASPSCLATCRHLFAHHVSP